MNFLKVFLRGLALLPSVVQSVEALYGAKSGAQKKETALSIVQASLSVTDGAMDKAVADASGFADGLSTVVDGVVACLNASLWHKA